MDESRLRRAIGAAIRAAREARGWSQLRLCVLCGVSQATLSRWESGTGPLDVVALYVVARALDRAAVELLSEAA